MSLSIHITIGILQRNQPVAYSDLDVEDVDDSVLVNDVIQGMLTKQVIPDSVMKDLDSKPLNKIKDPRPKMELRHKQVRYQPSFRDRKFMTKIKECFLRFRSMI